MRFVAAARIEGDGCTRCFTPNVYLICRNFATENDDVSVTNTVWSNHNPSFCYSEVR